MDKPSWDETVRAWKYGSFSLLW